MTVVEMTASVFLGNMMSIACFAAIWTAHKKDVAGEPIPWIALAGVILPMIFGSLVVYAFS